MTRPRYGSWSMPGPNGSTTTITPLDTRGPKRLWNAPAGYVVRERGDVDGLVTLEYLCPVHGRFEARVSRAVSPDVVACPLPRERWIDRVTESGCFERISTTARCEYQSPWSPSTFNAWQSSGEVKS